MWISGAESIDIWVMRTTSACLGSRTRLLQGMARNVNVMFRVYSKANALFGRSKRAFFTCCDLSAERH